MIRNAIKNDVKRIADLGYLMAKESRFSTCGYSFDKCVERINAFIELESGIVLVAEKKSIVVGFLVAAVSRRFFSDQLFSFEQVIYLSPEFRGGILGVSLIKEYIAQAKRLNAEVINIGISTGINEARTGQFYERLGFCRTGYCYTMIVE